MTQTKASEHTIWIHSGSLFDFLAPSSSDFTIQDIAHGLAYCCRFSGQCNKFYSVAEHSVIVSKQVPKELAMVGLFHDAAEAFVGDLSTPLKKLIPSFRFIEKETEKVIFARFDINWPPPPEVKFVDEEVFKVEQRIFFPRHFTNSDVGESESHDQIASQIKAWSPEEAENNFLLRYIDLKIDTFAERAFRDYTRAHMELD